MKLQISLIREETLKKLELRIPAVIYDQLLQYGFSPVELNLTDKEHFALDELAEQIGVDAEGVLYCGLQILINSAEDPDVREDCLKVIRDRLKKR